MIFLFMLLLGTEAKTITLKPTAKYQPVYEVSESFISRPGDVALDDKGRLYLLDLTARTIFVWNEDGSFENNFGKQGEGPGEFVFARGAGGSQGYISILNGKIYVFDGGARKVSIFNDDWTFDQSIPFTIESGRVEIFRPLTEDRFLVFYSSYFSDVPFRKIALYNRDKEPIVEITKVKDNTWNYVDKGGGRRGVEFHAFSESLIVVYNQANQQVIIGDSSKPSFDLYDIEGNALKTIEAPLTRKQVTKEDIKEYEERPWFKNQRFFTASFPEYMAYYDQILPVGKDRYLAFLESSRFRFLRGYLIDSKGQLLSRFTLPVGEGGRLLGTHGRLFGFLTDEEGEYTIAELVPAGKGDGAGVPGR